MLAHPVSGTILCYSFVPKIFNFSRAIYVVRSISQLAALMRSLTSKTRRAFSTIG